MLKKLLPSLLTVFCIVCNTIRRYLFPLMMCHLIELYRCAIDWDKDSSIRNQGFSLNPCRHWEEIISSVNSVYWDIEVYSGTHTETKFHQFVIKDFLWVRVNTRKKLIPLEIPFRLRWWNLFCHSHTETKFHQFVIKTFFCWWGGVF